MSPLVATLGITLITLGACIVVIATHDARASAPAVTSLAAARLARVRATTDRHAATSPELATLIRARLAVADGHAAVGTPDHGVEADLRALLRAHPAPGALGRDLHDNLAA